MTLGDCSVRFFANEVDLNVWHAHASIAGREVIAAE